MHSFFPLAVFLTLQTALAHANSSIDEEFFSGAPRATDGRYTNNVGEIGHGTLGTRVPFMLRRVATSFSTREGVPVSVPNDGAFLRDNAQQGVPTVTWIGHATLLVQMENVTFLTDPIWSSRPSPIPLVGPNRYVEPGLEMKNLPPIDFVVISHNHYDHLDIPTLRALAKRNPQTQFFVPMGNGKLLRNKGVENVTELDWGQSFDYKNTTVHCLPTQHWSKRSLTDTHKTLWSSWAVTGEQKRFYFAGDTGYFAGFKAIGERLGPFDLAAVPIGAYEPRAMMHESHMNPEEAVMAAQDVSARRAIAIHFGTFNLSDEPLDEPPLRFENAAQAQGLGASNAWVLNIGETRKF